ncbi:hypothetical protein SCUCBS95973_005511 [Sporothrix curviconia]|uniref:Aminoglycoside phosphotransferase domain-containing protein n=1 Tax=Sporothrix curviconia TaxID=1260050 RepID=A0ABP0BXL5_9PEZI
MSSPELGRAALRKAMAANEPMRRLKNQITYGALLRVVSQFPNVLGDDEPILEAVQAMAAAEFEKKPPREDDNDDADWGIIHGDFWSGKASAKLFFSSILLPSEDHLQSSSPARQLFVVDWEFAQYGHRAYDIGQLIGDLIERHHFRGATASLDVLAGFTSGYGFPGRSSQDDHRLAFRVAIHAGVQLIGCYIRRAPTGPLPGTPEQVKQALRLGIDFVLKGWAKDREWFKQSVLSVLFV